MVVWLLTVETVHSSERKWLWAPRIIRCWDLWNVFTFMPNQNHRLQPFYFTHFLFTQFVIYHCGTVFKGRGGMARLWHIGCFSVQLWASRTKGKGGETVVSTSIGNTDHDVSCSTMLDNHQATGVFTGCSHAVTRHLWWQTAWCSLSATPKSWL